MSPNDAPALLSQAMDFLSQLEVMLHTASVDERIAIEAATETIYGPNQGAHYVRLTDQVTELRDRIYDHLDQ